MKKISLLLFLILLLPLVISQPEQNFIFERLSEPNLPFSCKDDVVGGNCDAIYTCNLNAFYPNGTFLHNNTPLIRIGDGAYTITLTNLTVNGFYKYNGVCTNGSDTASSDDLQFRVTESGQVFSEGQSLVSGVLLIGSLITAFFFMIFGFKFSQNPKTLPLTLLFVIIAIFFIFYSLQLGLNITDNFIESEGLSRIQTTMYLSTLFLVTGIGIISFMLMTIAFVREFGKGKMMKDFGEGFDPITETYK